MCRVYVDYARNMHVHLGLGFGFRLLVEKELHMGMYR